MSLHGYHYSVKLNALDPPFEALIMAAMRKADSDNLELLKSTFPFMWEELQARYHAPAGIIPEDHITEENMEGILRNIAEFTRQKLSVR